MTTPLKALAAKLTAQRKTLATAESCTGGLLGGALTSVSGSSAWYPGGVVTYANEMKERLLNVPAAVLKRHGAVSPQTARRMAEGIRSLTGATLGLSITGIAGPTGGTPQKPVGLVYMGLACNGKRTAVFEHRFTGTRSQIRRQAVAAAIGHLLDAVND